MTDKRIENLNVTSEDRLITPDQVKSILPLNESAINTVRSGQETVKHILDRTDHRLFVVVGPCSIHDIDAAREYADRLKELSHRLEDTLFILMRVYFEKPRTRAGWQGLINDPFLDESYHIEDGLKMARELLLYLGKIGLPAAGEALDIITPQYIQDLFSWTAIGARTTESQSHRKMASGFSAAVGFKNGTNGDIDIAVNAISFASSAHNFISVDPAGQVAKIRTKGNPYSHIILRGGNQPNFDSNSVEVVEKILQEKKCKQNIMIDCSHANSDKNPEKQKIVLDSIINQIAEGNKSIVGLMLESNLNEGKQNLCDNRDALKYGVSITDACINWQTTEEWLVELRDRLKEVLPNRMG